MERTLPEFKISEKNCKACYICVEFCPKQVLEIKGTCVSVKNPDACIKCMQCEQRCPDFAIQVNP